MPPAAGYFFGTGILGCGIDRPTGGCMLGFVGLLNAALLLLLLLNPAGLALLDLPDESSTELAFDLAPAGSTDFLRDTEDGLLAL